MKKRSLVFLAALLVSGLAAAQNSSIQPNELVQFLGGDWHNYSVSVTEQKPVGQQDYTETMAIKNDSTLTITAHAYKDGQDITRDMILALHGRDITMQQGDFIARGTRKGNVYYLTGYAGDKEYHFRLYTLGDKYVFHQEVWSDGKAETVSMSYLLRQ